MTIGRTVPLMLAGAAGVFIAWGVWYLAVPALFASVFLQGEIIK